MEYLKVNGTEYPAHFCGKQIDRDWDGRASKTVTLAMPYAQVAGPITDNRDGTLSIKMGSYTQLEQALRELEAALT